MVIKPLLGLFVKDIIEESAKDIIKREAVKQIAESARREFLRTVAESYTRELTHNVSQYVRSIGSASVEVSSDNAGEDMFFFLQSALRTLEIELERQGPDSPVVRYLQKRYGEYKRSTYVGMENRPVYTMVPGYSDKQDPDQPWLNRILQSDALVGEILATEAARLFDLLFSPPEVT